MLKGVLFVHDHIFYHESGGNYYSEGKLPLSAFDRFLEISDCVDVLCREESIQNISSDSELELSSSHRVCFSPVRGRKWGVIFGSKVWCNIKRVWSLVGSCDLVVVRVPCFLSIAVIPVAFLLKKPYAVEVVGDAFEAIVSSRDGSIIRYLIARVFDGFTKHVVLKACGAIYVTERQLQARYPTNHLRGAASNVSIPDTPRKVLVERVNYIRKKSNSDYFKVGIIGSFKNNYKGIDLLIEAVRKLREEQGINVVLDIVGSGNRSNFQSELSRINDSDNWIRFVGRLDRSSIFEWLDGIDVYCQPSRTEGLPRALIEAMSRGCPAIGTRVGGIPELLEDDCLISVGDSPMLALCIERIILDREFAVAQSLRNFNHAKRYYDSELTALRSDFWSSVADRV